MDFFIRYLIKKTTIIAGLALFLIFASGCSLLPWQTKQGTSELKLFPKKSAAALEENSPLLAPLIDEQAVEEAYKNISSVPAVGAVAGAIVPHHAVAGYMPATLFSYLARQNPPLVVLIGPNHKNSGLTPVISSALDWQTPYGILKTDKKLLYAIAEKNKMVLDDKLIENEHSLYSLVPYVKKSLPDAKVIVLAIKYQTPTSTLEGIFQSLKDNLPEGAVVVGSIDFSHYLSAPVADFHDELSAEAVKSFDYNRFDYLDIDSAPTLYLVSRLMENRGTQKVAYEAANNAAVILGRPDLAETTSYYSPWFVKGQKDETRAASFLFFGDMMVERNVEKTWAANGGPDYMFQKLAGQENRFFMGADIVHANLEGPFADYRRETTKEIAFRFNPKVAPFLKKYRFSMFNLANNHTLDMGADGLVESKFYLRKNGLEYYGSEYAVDENSVLTKEIGGLKIAFFGFNDTHSRLPDDKLKQMIAGADADFKIVNIHWGEEYKPLSNTRQRALARALIDAGADAIIGHHPHVVQEMEIYKDRPIFYSLGNFIFDQYFSVPTQEGLAIGVVANKKPAGERSLSLYIFSLESVKSQPRQMEFEKAYKNLYDIINRSRLGEYEFKNFSLKINL